MTVLRAAVVAGVVVVATGAAACHSAATVENQAARPARTCDEPYVAINNRTGKPIDIYAYNGFTPELIGEVTASANQLSLLGTRLEHFNGMPVMYATTLDGTRVSGGHDHDMVQLTRKCS